MITLITAMIAPFKALAADVVINDNTPRTAQNLPSTPNDGYVVVGDTNPNQLLTFEQSYSLSLLTLGLTQTSSGNTVRIRNAGTAYTNTTGSPAVTGPALLVGQNSSDNLLEVVNGASLQINKPDTSSSYDVVTGYNNGANNNTFRISGIGSTLTVNDSTIYTGYAGSYNTLEILNGASVSTLQMRIGGGTGSATGTNAGATPAGNVVRVDGAGSTLTALGSVNLGATLGAIGGSNRLEITNGAIATLGITNSKTLAVGQHSSSNSNQLLVSGQGSTLNANAIAIGNGSNANNTLKFGDGAQINANSLALNNNSILEYGIGGQQAALATAATTLTIGSGVMIKPYLTPGSSLRQNSQVLKLNTGTITGSLTLDLSLLPQSLSPLLQSTNSAVNLSLTANLGANASLNRNQANVALGINTAFNQGAVLPAPLSDLFSTSSNSALAQSLSGLSGEAATGAQQTILEAGAGFLNLISGAAAGTMPADNSQRSAAKSSLWVDGFGFHSTLQGNAGIGSQELNNQAGGGVLGLNHRLSEATVVGAAIGGIGSQWSLASSLGGGTSEGVQLGVFTHHAIGAGYLKAGLGYGNYWTHTNRTYENQVLTADSSAALLSGRIEGGYRISQGSSGLTPYAAMVVQHYGSPSYTERGGSAALTYQASAITDPRTELGLTYDAAINAATLSLRAAWLHSFDPGATMAAAFEAVPGSSFSVTGASRSSDAALLAASIHWDLNRSTALKVELNSELSNQQISLGGLLRLKTRW